jgi:DNA-binding MarR family transcriptional regulator
MGTTPSTTINREELAPRLRLAVTRTARRLRQEAGGELGPSGTASLATIDRHGPLGPSELAERERISKPTATRIVRHLEGAGLIARASNPGDGRCSILTVTPAGREFLRELRARKTAYFARRLPELGEEDVAALERAVELLEHMLELDHPAAEQPARTGGAA